MTSELTLDFLLKVDQNQIIFPMIPKFLCFREKFPFKMTSCRHDPQAIKEKVSGKASVTPGQVSRQAWFWCLYCWLWTYFIPYSSVSIVNFEHVIADWESIILPQFWSLPEKIILLFSKTSYVINFSQFKIWKVILFLLRKKICNKKALLFIVTPVWFSFIFQIQVFHSAITDKIFETNSSFHVK